MNEKEFPLVEVIIVTYNGENYVHQCLRSVCNQDYPKEKYVVTVIDNHSTDKTCKLVNEYPGITIIYNNKNMGFAKANNIALRKSNASYALLLNQDSWIKHNFISRLVEVMKIDSSIGVCGSAEHPPDQTLISTRKIEETTWVGLGATMINMKAASQVGFLDENYFMYHEDIDLCWRLRFAGWKIYYTPHAVWHHFGWKRVVSEDNPRIIHSFASRVYLLMKFASIAQLLKSLIIYAKRRAAVTTPRVCHKTIHQQSSIRRTVKSYIKIILNTLPKIPFALINRTRVRKLPFFNQQQADMLIRETYTQLYEQ